MMVFSIGLLLLGIFLSAFFSGSETGFYRASRVRLVIRNLEGDSISRYLLMLVNNPALFVATTLIGNNVANYITSLSIVLLTTSIWKSSAAEMLAPILMAPMLFVYGELMPKNLFFQAPNSLLRLAAPLFLLAVIVFVPASILLWGMSSLLERLLGQAPEKIRLTLARRELQEVIEEGIEAGLIRPTQRALGQNFSLMASKPVGEVCLPLAKVDAVDIRTKKSQVKKLAARKALPDVPVYHGNRRNVIGYVRAVELLIDASPDGPIENVNPLPELSSEELFGEALLQMQTNQQTIARVVAGDGSTVGLLSIDQLTDPLLKGPLLSLRR